MNFQSLPPLSRLTLPGHQQDNEPPPIQVTVWAEQEGKEGPLLILPLDVNPDTSVLRVLSAASLPLSGLFTEQVWFPLQNILGRKKKKSLETFSCISIFKKNYIHRIVLVGRNPTLDTMEISACASNPKCFHSSCDWDCLLQTIKWPRRLTDFPGLPTLTRHVGQTDVFLPLE